MEHVGKVRILRWFCHIFHLANFTEHICCPTKGSPPCDYCDYWCSKHIWKKLHWCAISGTWEHNYIWLLWGGFSICGINANYLLGFRHIARMQRIFSYIHAALEVFQGHLQLPSLDLLPQYIGDHGYLATRSLDSLGCGDFCVLYERDVVP